MHTKLNGATALLLVVFVATGIAIGMSLSKPAVAEAPDAKNGAAPHYSVISTEGINLIVTDNEKNVTFFYTVDEGEEPGAELKLRGSIDLTQVGKPVVKPKLLVKKK